MSIKKKAARYQTGIASEFYILSALYRLGLDANLTFGNRKAIDILLVNNHDVTATIDVKGLASKTGWPVDNVKHVKSNHFLVFVCYLNDIADLTKAPKVFIVPSAEVQSLLYIAQKSGRRLVTYKTLREKAERYENAWHFITDLTTSSASLLG